MAKKKQSESVATRNTRVLRPRTSTTGEAKVEEKAKGKLPVIVDEKAKGKVPVRVNEKANGKKTVASGKLKIGDAEKSEIAGKRKVMSDEENREAAGSRVKKVKATNKNDKDNSAASGSTPLLGSKIAKKGDKAKKEVAKKESAKGKTHKETVEANMSSAVKGSCQLIVDFTGPEFPNKRATRSATKGQVALKKDLKGKKILKRKEETVSDEDIHKSEMKKEAPLTIGSPKPKNNLPAKEVPLTIGSPKPKENLHAEPSKRTTRRGGKSKDDLSQEHAEDTAAVASSSKMVPKQVSKAQNKTKGRANANTNK